MGSGGGGGGQNQGKQDGWERKRNVRREQDGDQKPSERQSLNFLANLAMIISWVGMERLMSWDQTNLGD